MSPKTPGAPTKTNYSLAILWLASLVVGLVGYVLMTSSNSGQADLYTKQSADYGRLFTLQSGSSLGATLIAVGVLGLLIALATHAVSFAIARSAGRMAAVTEEDLTDTDVDAAVASPMAAGPAVAFTAPETTTQTTTPAASTTQTTETPQAAGAATDAPSVVFDETPPTPAEGDAKA